jgi:hypothetical protein
MTRDTDRARCVRTVDPCNKAFYRPTGDIIELIRVYHAARDVDQINPTGS